MSDIDLVREAGCKVIAINRAYRLAPWADWLWGCDADRFWAWHSDAVDFAGTKIVIRPCGDASSYPARWAKLAELAAAGVNILRHSAREYPGPARHEGASSDPAVVYGNNSLYQILSVIAHTGASTVLLIWADMTGGHWHEGYSTGEPDYAISIVPYFETLVQPLKKAGVTVINCTPGSAIPYWPVLQLEAVL